MDEETKPEDYNKKLENSPLKKLQEELEKAKTLFNDSLSYETEFFKRLETKYMKFLPTLIFIALLFPLTLNATPVSYTYIGSNYNTQEGPESPGVSLTDHMEIFLTLDSAKWGVTSFNDDIVGTLISGPWFSGDPGKVLTDMNGNIISWSLTGSGPSLDMESYGNIDGSGLDSIDFYNKPVCPASVVCGSYIHYPAGQRPTGTGWVMTNGPASLTSVAPVKEPASLILLGISLIGIVGVKKLWL